jgi:chromosome segregation ATPase
MNWFFFAVSMGLLGFLAEIFWRYRRDNSLTLTRQAAITQAIEKRRRNLEKARVKIDATQTGINGLKEERERLKKDLELARLKLDELEARESRRRPGHQSVDKEGTSQ